jgi:hypothetical protein
VAAAVYEAVEAGSAYVAPRRLREILTRWERDGFPGQERGTAPVSTPPRERAESTASYTLADGDDFELPHGFGSRRTWAFTVSLLAGALAPERLAELVNGTAIAGYANGEATVAAISAEQARLLTGEYGGLVARKLGEAMRRPVRIAAIVSAEQAAASSRPQAAKTTARATRSDEPVRSRTAESTREPEREPAEPSFIVSEVGLPNAQVWAAVLDEVARAGAVSPANVDIWLRTTRLLGRGEGGRLIVGAAHPIAQQRIATRFAAPLQAAVAAVLGAAVPLDIVVAREWLLAHAPRPELDGAA